MRLVSVESSLLIDFLSAGWGDTASPTSMSTRLDGGLGSGVMAIILGLVWSSTGLVGGVTSGVLIIPG